MFPLPSITLLAGVALRYTFSMGINPRILSAVFIASLSSLAYEITLTRIFSISLWYHFAFMVISIAMLGIGASGTLLSVYPGLQEKRHIPLYLFLLSLSIPASYLLMNAVPFDPAQLSWDRTQLLYIALYYLVLSFPFFFFGMAVTSSLSSFREQTGFIYAADLTGAGTGSLLTLLLLSGNSPDRIVFLISCLSAMSLFAYGNRTFRLAAIVLLMVNIGMLHAKPPIARQRISPYKPLETALRFPGAEPLRTFFSPFSRIDIFRSPAVRYAPGLSLTYLDHLPEQIGVAADAGDIHAVTHAGERGQLSFLKYLPSSLPYEISSARDVLILEPKGGLAVLAAEYYGAGRVCKVDSDPLMIHSIREYLPTFSSGIYERNTWTGLGRSWLSRATTGFDLIDVSVMGSMPAGSYGYSEDYRFTLEAFETYLRSLRQDGILSINLFLLPPPRSELRFLNTLIEASAKLGISESRRHIAAIRSWGTITMIFKKSPLTGRDIAQIKRFTKERRFDLVFYPGITEQETNINVRTPSNEYFAAFQALTSPDGRQKFIDDYLFDISPVHDENPFFHYYLKLRNIREIYKSMGEKWQYFIEEGYLLPVIFIQVLLLGLLLVFLPAAFRKPKGAKIRGNMLVLAYFGFLGTGFMFIEICFIQRMILLVENPSFAAAAVLSSMLISSGIGSFLSGKFKAFRSMRVLFILSLVIFIYALFLPLLMNALSAYPLKVKLASVFFILLPAGIFMGIPFPLGLFLLGSKRPELIPWAWAVNGCLSVLAPILAVMLAITFGFRVVIFGGAIIYLLAYLSLRHGTQSVLATRK